MKPTIENSVSPASPFFGSPANNLYKDQINSDPQMKPVKNIEIDFCIAVDTREQLPYTFDGHECCVERLKLDYGDYSVKGLEHLVSIERKSLVDLLHSITHERTRFFREISQLSKLKRSAVLVEADFQDIVERSYQKDVNVNAVIGTINTISVDYGVPVMFGGRRQFAQAWAFHYLQRFAKADKTSR